MVELKNIRYWLFDLDNTLYSGDTKVFDQRIQNELKKTIKNNWKENSNTSQTKLHNLCIYPEPTNEYNIKYILKIRYSANLKTY